MLILNSPQILHQKVSQWKSDHRIHLVPTMGCLHRGHLSLIEKAKAENTKVIASIFVNPLQFGPNEDFEKYPRTFDDDVKQLEEAGVDCLFAPRTIDLYPEGFAMQISMKGLGDHLCGKSRPGHFNGVLTVCLKLFQITQADSAIFGEKDFQQLRIIEKMVEDLNLAIRIIPHPIVREADGLALSSRNRYLDSDQRQVALKIPEAIFGAQKMALGNGDIEAGNLVGFVRESLSHPFVVDYVEVASSHDLRPVANSTPLSEIRQPRLFVAAKLGNTRLIDNVALFGTEN